MLTPARRLLHHASMKKKVIIILLAFWYPACLLAPKEPCKAATITATMAR